MKFNQINANRKLEKKFKNLLNLVKRKNLAMYKAIRAEKDLHLKSMYLYTLKEIPEVIGKLSYDEFRGLFAQESVNDDIDNAIESAQWNSFVDDMHEEAKDIVRESDVRQIQGMSISAIGFGFGFGVVLRLLKSIL